MLPLRPARSRLVAPDALRVGGAAILAAIAFGAMTAMRTEDSVMALAVGVVLVACVFLPLAALTILLGLTVLVPYATLNEYSLAGGVGVPGLLLIDLGLAVAVARVAVIALRRRQVSRPVAIALILLGLAALQLVHGVARDWGASEAGTEARRIAMAIGGFLLAAPVLAGPERRHLPAMLLVLSLTLGSWGAFQWFTDMPFNGSDAGVRQGVGMTSSGRGQLQGGLFAYPAAVVLTFAALVSGRLRSGWPTALTGIALVANAMCLLFTYERTFWGATVLGCGFVLARGTPQARRRALRWVPPILVAGVLTFAVTAPEALRTALERGASVSEVGSDSSVEYRQVEAREVLRPIAAEPVLGSGFGAPLTWRPPAVPEDLTTPFVHNGYLWLAWKTGIPMMLLLVTLMAMSALRRAPSSLGDLDGWLCVAAQGSLLGLLLINVTFPSFNILGVGVATGLLVALAWVAPPAAAAPGRTNGQESEAATENSRRFSLSER